MYTVAQYRSQLSKAEVAQTASLEKLIDDTLKECSGDVINVPLGGPLPSRVQQKLVKMYQEGGWIVEHLTTDKSGGSLCHLKFTQPPHSPGQSGWKD